MNQDSFRQLLTTPRPGSSSSLTPTRAVGPSTKKLANDKSQPAFKPRKVKKDTNESHYRDRASERRAGVNDYAQVESVLEDFEQRTAELEDREAVEEQRRYLGGDKDHTILVKGLDFALLEQNKARAAASHEDDDSLEVAFQEAQAKPVVPKRRTREDLIRELKEKRAFGTETSTQEATIDDALEKAKKVGKFKPIGAQDQFKQKEKSKRAVGKEEKGEEERKKKRRKIVREPGNTNGEFHTKTTRPQQNSMAPPSQLAESPTPRLVGTSAVIASAAEDPKRVLEYVSPSMVDDDIDIFADAGDYEGVNFGEDEDDEQLKAGDSVEKLVDPRHLELDRVTTVKAWFDDESTTIPGPSVARSPTPHPVPADEPEPEPEKTTRLVPLASSSLPSIRDFLAMEAQAEAQEKRKAKIEKKKGSGGGKKEKASAEVKADRDYQKLNSYINKKGGGSKDV